MSTIKTKINGIIYHLFQFKVHTSLTLFFLAFLSYGLLIHQLGFYWDDFPYLYLNHSQGIIGYPAYMASDRPFSAWFFMLEGILFGENPFGYHFLALVLRWAGAYVFYLILEKIFPLNKLMSFMAAALFLVYPGFMQQPISVIYSLHFAVLLLFLLSVFFMTLSLENNPHSTLYTLLGLICAMSIFSSEYFAFLEFIRPVIIWFFYRRQNFSSLISFRKILRIWSPYLIIFIVFLIWRIFIFKFPTYSPDLLTILKDDLIFGIAHLFTRILRDLFTVIIQSWLSIFSFHTLFEKNIFQIMIWLFFSAISGLLVCYQVQKVPRESAHKDPSVNRTMILAGVILIILAGIPIWATDLPIKLEFAWDRLTLPFSLGASLFFAGFLSLLIKKRSLLIFIFSLLIGLSSGFHINKSYQYLEEWISLQDFFQQITWRVPGLTKGTTLVTDKFPLEYYSDNSLTAPLNWIYDTENHSLDLNYMFYFLDVRLGRRLPDLEKGLEINQPYRSFSFKGGTDQIIFLQYEPPSCVHLFDDSSNIILRNDSTLLQKAAHLSDINLIQYKQTYSFPSFFTSEPNKNWCYYYEKAELARQQSNWNEAINLLQEAFTYHFEPSDPNEYFPFLEAYGQVSDFESALRISKLVLNESIGMEKNICAIWNKFIRRIPFENMGESAAQLYYSELKCIL